MHQSRHHGSMPEVGWKSLAIQYLHRRFIQDLYGGLGENRDDLSGRKCLHSGLLERLSDKAAHIVEFGNGIGTLTGEIVTGEQNAGKRWMAGVEARIYDGHDAPAGPKSRKRFA